MSQGRRQQARHPRSKHTDAKPNSSGPHSWECSGRVIGCRSAEARSCSPLNHPGTFGPFDQLREILKGLGHHSHKRYYKELRHVRVLPLDLYQQPHGILESRTNLRCWLLICVYISRPTQRQPRFTNISLRASSQALSGGAGRRSQSCAVDCGRQ